MFVQAWLNLSLLLLAGTTEDPCAATAGHRGYTILVDAHGQFVHCRRGALTDTGPIEGERVSLELPAVDPHRPYRFRLLDPTQTPPSPKRRPLDSQLQMARWLADALHAIAGAPEEGGLPMSQEGARQPRIGTILMPTPLSPAMLPAIRDVHARREEYVAVATPEFHDAVAWLRGALPDIRLAFSEVDGACAHALAAMAEGLLKEEVRQTCDAGGPAHHELTQLATFEETFAVYLKARRHAREALLTFSLKPQTVGEQESAAKAAAAALDAATSAAKALVGIAPELETQLAHFLKKGRFLQLALSIPPSHLRGQRIVLGRFSSGGLFSPPVTYQLHLWRGPSALFDLAEEEESTSDADAPAQTPTPAAGEYLIDRFEPLERRFFSLELALTYSSGLPDHPALVGRLGQQTLVPERTQGFSGGVLASLEPLQFIRPEEPWAQALRLPTVIVPFTLNPLENYFIGAGIGWNDVGSINVGAHLALTSVPAPGTPYGTTFTTSPVLLSHVTQPGRLAAGYFISASLDVLGLAHLFFQHGQPVVRDVYTGSALAP